MKDIKNMSFANLIHYELSLTHERDKAKNNKLLNVAKSYDLIINEVQREIEKRKEVGNE